MQNRMSLHKRSTVMPCTGLQVSSGADDECSDPLGNSCDTVQFTSRQDRALRKGEQSCVRERETQIPHDSRYVRHL